MGSSEHARRCFEAVADLVQAVETGQVDAVAGGLGHLPTNKASELLAAEPSPLESLAAGGRR